VRSILRLRSSAPPCSFHRVAGLLGTLVTLMSDSERLDALRRDYRHAELDMPSCPDHPFDLFRGWIQEARSAEVLEPNAMTLCTVDASGAPAGRVVLLKAVTPAGFIFYTNYRSGKGQHLEATPRAALVFWWDVLERQVRIEGDVVQVPPEVSDAYFASRPRASRIGAWASPQSEPVADRSDLDRRTDDAERSFPNDIPRPPHWGGYEVRPHRMEFWQGRTGRMHDRIEYARRSDAWVRRRLAP
jgi:pyridoxamine 5'-phosphate oxidase